MMTMGDKKMDAERNKALEDQARAAFEAQNYHSSALNSDGDYREGCGFWGVWRKAWFAALAAAPSPVAQPQQIKPLKRYDCATDDLSRPIAREDENGEFVRHDEAQEQINAAWRDGAASCSASPVAQDERELPPLPKEWQCETAMCPKLYTGDQMRDYALAARAATPAQDKQDTAGKQMPDDPKMAAYLKDQPYISAYIATLESELRKVQSEAIGQINRDGVELFEHYDRLPFGSKLYLEPPKNPTPLPAGSQQEAVAMLEFLSGRFKYGHISHGKNGYHYDAGPIPGDDMDFDDAIRAAMQAQGERG